MPNSGHAFQDVQLVSTVIEVNICHDCFFSCEEELIVN